MSAVSYREWLAEIRDAHEPMVLMILKRFRGSGREWLTPRELTNEMDQREPLAAIDVLPRRKRCELIYQVCFRLRSRGLVESCLGSNDGREIRVFRALEV